MVERYYFSSDIINNILKLNFEIGKILSECTESKKFTMSTILNNRKIGENDFSSVIGDFHRSHHFIYNNDWVFERFQNSYKKSLDLFEKGNIYTHSKLKSSLNYKSIAKTNFIGDMSSQNLDAFLNIQKELKSKYINKNGLRIQISFIMSNGYFYSVWLNYPDNIKSFLQNNHYNYITL